MNQNVGSKSSIVEQFILQADIMTPTEEKEKRRERGQLHVCVFVMCQLNSWWKKFGHVKNVGGSGEYNK